MKKIIIILLSPVILAALLFSAVLIWLTLTDFRPAPIEEAEVKTSGLDKAGDRLTILNWNIGYGGLGGSMDFFMDGGTRVRAPREEYTRYREGIFGELGKTDFDIYFFQEMDRKSTRSYKEDQYKLAGELFNDYNSTFAPNYKVKFIPSPTIVGTQYGSVHSGLATFTKYAIADSERIALPGNFKWPQKILFLDRCMLVTTIVHEPSGREIVLINTHKSAYDKGGVLKKLQLEFIKEYAEKLYEAGKYVIIGGDWNSYMPGTDGHTFPSEEPVPDYYQSLPADWNMDGWTWGIDRETPTNRSLAAPYEKGKTFTSVIDGFLLSPNIQLEKVNTVDMGFRFSDHNPIEMTFILRGL